MIRFTLRQLKYFIAAAEAGSTLRAAQKLNVSQPAISVAIGQLEEIFGQKLFIRRHSQGVDLTPYGRRKLNSARELMAQANAFNELGEGEVLSGELELGVFSTLAPAYAPGLLSAFRKAYPQIRVRMREMDLEQIQGNLSLGRIELALLYQLELGGGFESLPLADFWPYAVLPAGHPLAEKEVVDLRELADYPLVLINLPQSRDYFISLFRQVDAIPEDVINCNSIETLRGMVANGFGVSVLVTRPSHSLSHDGLPLVYRPLVNPVPPHRVILALPGVPVTPAMQAFISVARDWFASLSKDTGNAGDWRQRRPEL